MTTIVAGSLNALVGSSVLTGVAADVVVIPTAAAFLGAAEVALEVALALEPFASAVEALMVVDRSGAEDESIARRIAQADLVVLADGSPLHAKAVWRDSSVGAALAAAASLVAIGAVATTLGTVMIDPRGGAPTIGLGYRRGVVLTTPAPPEQLSRTRRLYTGDESLVVVGARGVLVESAGVWRVTQADDVEVINATGGSSLY